MNQIHKLSARRCICVLGKKLADACPMPKCGGQETGVLLPLSTAETDRVAQRFLLEPVAGQLVSRFMTEPVVAAALFVWQVYILSHWVEV